MNTKLPNEHLSQLQAVLADINALSVVKVESEGGALLRLFDILQILQANVEFREMETKTVKVTGNALGFEQVVIIAPHEVSIKEEKV